MDRFERFRARLRRLGFASYAEYLRSPLWFETRRRFLLAHPDCFACGTTVGVVPHHRTYKRLGQERTRDYYRADLVTLCHRCHGLVHRLAKHRLRKKGANRENLGAMHTDVRQHLPHLLAGKPCGGMACRVLSAGSRKAGAEQTDPSRGGVSWSAV